MRPKIELPRTIAVPWVFPLSAKPSVSWHEGARKFGAMRKNGRLHAGCDLYTVEGAEIRAVANGVVNRFSAFYAKTWALEVDHGAFTVRYGEIRSKLPKGIRVGTEVVAGDVIAYVGHLVGIVVPSDMLHFELYSNKAEGNLSQSLPPYQRRSDLLDPTRYLHSATPWSEVVWA